MLVAFGGGNDCHTPGWRGSDATIPVSRWMTGNEIGFRGLWGTVRVRYAFYKLRYVQGTDLDRGAIPHNRRRASGHA